MEILTGNSYLFRKSRFLGYAVVIVKESDVENTVATLMEKNNVQEATKTPFAYRLANCEKEGCDDGNEIGAGDKLLYLLRKWEIENVFVMVARNDRSLSGRLIGSQRYKYILESAKSAIEKCFHAHLEVNFRVHNLKLIVVIAGRGGENGNGEERDGRWEKRE